MTKTVKAALAALMLAGISAPAVAQQLSPPVIVIVDMERIVNESAAGKQAGTEIQGKVTALQSRGSTLQNQLKTEADAIQAGQANKTLAGPALDQRVQAFGQKQQQAQQAVGRLEQDIQRSRQYGIKQITDAEIDSAAFEGALFEGEAEQLKALNQRLVKRSGPIVNLQGLTPAQLKSGQHYGNEILLAERSISINTAAAGGNASLMTMA